MNEVGRLEWPRLCYQCQVFTRGPGGLGIWDAVQAGFRAVLRCLDEIESDGVKSVVDIGVWKRAVNMLTLLVRHPLRRVSVTCCKSGQLPCYVGGMILSLICVTDDPVLGNIGNYLPIVTV
jgi:hypothetical protein